MARAEVVMPVGLGFESKVIFHRAITGALQTESKHALIVGASKLTQEIVILLCSRKGLQPAFGLARHRSHAHAELHNVPQCTHAWH